MSTALVVVVTATSLLSLWPRKMEQMPKLLTTGSSLNRETIDVPQNPQQQLTPTETVRSLGDEEGFLLERPSKPVVVAYAISLIKCSDAHSTPAGLIDAALTLRHSVHLTSSRNNKSHYDYEMFAIVHEKAESCSHVLKDAGFRVLVRKNPIEKEEIQDENLRKDIHRAWCCGHDEFIKLFAYHLVDYPIVVHVDMDFLFFNPMDVAFDAMLYHPASTIGRTAREQLPLEFPKTQQWPRNITALMTRDWPQVCASMTNTLAYSLTACFVHLLCSCCRSSQAEKQPTKQAC